MNTHYSLSKDALDPLPQGGEVRHRGIPNGPQIHREVRVALTAPTAVKAGTILAVIGDEGHFSAPDEVHAAETAAIDVALAGAARLVATESANPRVT